jgi:hypothetical protein
MISKAAHEFLAKYVDSAELLDILMLLYGNADAVWTPESVSNRVFTVPQAAERRLEELKARGIVTDDPARPGAYKVDLNDQEVRDILPELLNVYRTNRADVINIVFRIKADPVKSFSNAFKLRGES